MRLASRLPASSFPVSALTRAVGQDFLFGFGGGACYGEKMPTEVELLRCYADEKSEAAFGELVRRQVNLVYSVALRQCGGDAHLAEDVAQRVFTDLARKARSLSGYAVLGGWLYRSAQFAASDVVRAERRRRAREQEASAMQEISSQSHPGGDADWQKLAPVLDQAIGELGERDRDAVVLRFFEGRPFAEIGATLRLTEAAARMRVERALEKLRVGLGRRGITSTTTALGVALANQVGIAAPAGLAAAVTGVALAGAAIGGTATLAGFLGFMSTTKIMVAVAIVAVGAGVLQYRAAREERKRAAEQQHELRVKLGNVEQRRAAESNRADAADADNASLLQAIAAARSKPSRPVSAEQLADNELMPADKMTNRGKATPRDALETFYWASNRGDIETLAATIVLPEPVRQEAQGIWEKLPVAKRLEFRDPYHFVAGLLTGLGPMPGFQITKEEVGATSFPTGFSLSEIYGLELGAATDPTYRTLQSKTPLKNGRYSEPTLLFQLAPDGWRFVVPPNKFISGLWKRREQQSAAEGRASR